MIDISVHLIHLVTLSQGELPISWTSPCVLCHRVAPPSPPAKCSWLRCCRPEAHSALVMMIVTTTHLSGIIPVSPSPTCSRVLFRLEHTHRPALRPPGRHSCGSPRSTLNGTKLHKDRSHRICSSRAHATQEDRHAAWSRRPQYPHCCSLKLYLLSSLSLQSARAHSVSSALSEQYLRAFRRPSGLMRARFLTAATFALPHEAPLSKAPHWRSLTIYTRSYRTRRQIF